jgi:hypothetical protein
MTSRAGEGKHVCYGAMQMNILQTIVIIVGLLSGMSGLVLGVLNYWHQRDTTRPRILVRPGIGHYLVEKEDKTLAKQEPMGIVEVCNIGRVPVVGGDIGIKEWHRGRWSDSTFNYKSINGVEWPGELKPGYVAILEFDFRCLRGKLKTVFARTMIGDTFKASRRDMRKLAKQLKAISPSAA